MFLLLFLILVICVFSLFSLLAWLEAFYFIDLFKETTLGFVDFSLLIFCSLQPVF